MRALRGPSASLPVCRIQDSTSLLSRVLRRLFRFVDPGPSVRLKRTERSRKRTVARKPERPMPEPKLCVTVAGRTMEELRRDRDAAGDADLVELRLDLVDRPDVAGALHGRRVPVIVTCRAQWEGGGFAGSEEERRRILESAVDARGRVRRHRGGRELCSGLRAPRAGRGIVLSSHLFGRSAGGSRGPLREPARDRRRSRQARDSGDGARRDVAAVRARGERRRTSPATGMC